MEEEEEQHPYNNRNRNNKKKNNRANTNNNSNANTNNNNTDKSNNSTTTTNINQKKNINNTNTKAHDNTMAQYTTTTTTTGGGDDAGGGDAGGGVVVVLPTTSRVWKTVTSLRNMERIDKYLGYHPEFELTRSALNKLFENGAVKVNGNVVKKNFKVKDGQEIEITLPPTRDEPREVISLKPVEIPLEIVYEDDHLAVINKQSGLVVHPGEGEIKDETLVNALLFRYGVDGLSSGENLSRPGIVHRLDKDTSGLMIICKTNHIHPLIKQQFQEKTLKKFYHALVLGNMTTTRGVFNGNVMRHPKIHHKMVVTKDSSGKTATTEYEVLKSWRLKKYDYTLLQLQLHTGRTHQIRVHLANESHPIVGDILYHKHNAKHNVEGLCLVSKRLMFHHPVLSKNLDFEVDYPDHFKGFLEYLDSKCEKEKKNDDDDDEDEEDISF